jgi:hypothetical protein
MGFLRKRQGLCPCPNRRTPNGANPLTRTQRLIYIAACLIGAVFVLTYRGPFWQFTRACMGDWLIIQFIYMIARLWIPDRFRYPLAIAVFLLGILAEVIQYLGASSIPRNFAAELTIGSTFDPVDIAAYALGVITVLLIEHAISARNNRVSGFNDHSTE